jgi:hypothetical protein
MARKGQFLAPASFPLRDPLDAKVNGRIHNPPRFAEMGGLSSKSKAVFKNDAKLGKPGDVTSAN